MQDPLNSSYPVLPLRDIVVFPHMIVPLFVGREKSVRALEEVMADDKQILLAAQRDPSEDDPQVEGIFDVGVIANVLQLLKLPDGTVKVLVEGQARVSVTEYLENDSFFEARAEYLTEMPGDAATIEALVRTVSGEFERYAKVKKNVPEEALASVMDTNDPAKMADLVSGHLGIEVHQKQELLETLSVSERLEKTYGLMQGEMSVLQVEKKIKTRVKTQMERTQREYYLNEQMKAIQKELGDMEDVPNEIEDLADRIEMAGMSEEAKTKVSSELQKLKMMSPMSAEATVVRNYIETLVNLPWKKRSRLKSNLGQAEAILEEDHYGLEKVKERILEYLAVQKRVKKLKGPILCLVGPPGVGKTSLGKSIARATGRKFSRMALGGVRDEAEIRGHRRTYIGSMPGKILQNITKAETRNPLLLLDEIDKMSTDFRGDPSSALLEVLDPEQNNTFSDHYLEVEYDLSDVMFVATANTMNIPAPLLDRMEVIRIPGYTESEKLHIAQNYLMPRKVTDNGLRRGEMVLSEDAITDIIRRYTREAGVRNLEREISKICRKIVTEILLQEGTKSVEVTPENLDKYLGVPQYRFGKAEEEDQIGQVTGLAWTSVGGELLTIETAVVPGKGKFTYTGQLGDVMKESIQAAQTVVRSRAQALGLAEDFHECNDIHIHVPEGATPKDGPSAGIGMCTALVSALTGIAVKADVAMTGEITLRGEVLPIGGLKEKLLAAHRGDIKTVIIPSENEKDLAEIPAEVKDQLIIKPVQWIDDVLTIALAATPVPLIEDAGESKTKADVSKKKSSQSVRHH
ncbi:endopeptidase La [Chromatiales bacterium (ex Bugula neritina AB1)]|nr:endopeptidase La [Chromatiales bacterium (ex Bugula neritina AB1)]